MQLLDFTAFFQPEELAALGAAYNAAWKDLRTTKLNLRAAQASVLRRNLVQILLAAACNGTRDVDHLKEIALRGVSRGQHARPNRRAIARAGKRLYAWGVTVANVEIKHVDIDQTMVRAIARQAEAERERRAKIINAEGEAQAAQKLLEAANILSKQPEAMQLRYLSTLNVIAGEMAEILRLHAVGQVWHDGFSWRMTASGGTGFLSLTMSCH